MSIATHVNARDLLYLLRDCSVNDLDLGVSLNTVISHVHDDQTVRRRLINLISEKAVAIAPCPDTTAIPPPPCMIPA